MPCPRVWGLIAHPILGENPASGSPGWPPWKTGIAAQALQGRAGGTRAGIQSGTQRGEEEGEVRRNEPGHGCAGGGTGRDGKGQGLIPGM